MGEHATSKGADHKMFLIKRLHSLSGIIPIGVFLFEHLFTNSFSHAPETYNFIVQKIILGNEALVPLLELGVLLIPIGFHVGLGLYMTQQMSFNQGTYSNERNWAYLLQRVTGIVTLAFLLFHVVALRLTQKDAVHDDPFGTTAAHLNSSMFFPHDIMLFYVIGIAASCYHMGNGVWLFLIRWGIVVKRQTQEAARMPCLAVGFALMVLGFWALYGFYGKAPAQQEPAVVEAVEEHHASVLAEEAR